MIVPMEHLLILATLLFVLGFSCVLVRRNLIMILIGVEIMINAAGLVFIGASALWQQVDGQVMVLILMAITAAEVAIALALVVYLHQRKKSIEVGLFDEMRG